MTALRAALRRLSNEAYGLATWCRRHPVRAKVEGILLKARRGRITDPFARRFLLVAEAAGELGAVVRPAAVEQAKRGLAAEPTRHRATLRTTAILDQISTSLVDAERISSFPIRQHLATLRKDQRT